MIELCAFVHWLTVTVMPTHYLIFKLSINSYLSLTRISYE